MYFFPRDNTARRYVVRIQGVRAGRVIRYYYYYVRLLLVKRIIIQAANNRFVGSDRAQNHNAR